jgi:uncharacterized protein
MLRLTDLKLPLGHGEGAIRAALLKRLRIPDRDLVGFSVFRRSTDARKKPAIVLTYTLDVEVADETRLLERLARDRNITRAPDMSYRFVARAPAQGATRPVVIGAGPCGLFAALVLAQMGFRPIILERGKVVRERTKDTWGLWRRSVLNPESNVQFGHHHGRKVLTEFVAAGAPGEILTLGKPHIGTFRLVTIVENMRRTIEALGGEYRFESRVEDLDIEIGRDGLRHVRGAVLADGTHVATDRVVLAIGHSARSTFEMLYERGVAMEAKPFSIGVRIEHPQSLIDRCRFGESRPELGAADYKLVHHASNGRSVYSFCMCPGGTVVAATSEEGRVVTNGMSQYSRNERNANAGLVVGTAPADYPGDPLAGIAFQRQWEERAFAAGGGTYAAPAQLVGDFLERKASTTLGGVVPSYRPGVYMADLAACLPDFAVAAIREAIPAFDRQISGFAMTDAVMTGVETRTSSPLRIGRDASLQSPNTGGLYPAGEGAGYAGGILSAAVDGIRVAEAVALAMTGEEARAISHSNQSTGCVD